MILDCRLPPFYRISFWRPARYAYDCRCICGNLPCCKGHSDRAVLSSWLSPAIFKAWWLGWVAMCCSLHRRGRLRWRDGRRSWQGLTPGCWINDFEASLRILQSAIEAHQFACHFPQGATIFFYFPHRPISFLLHDPPCFLIHFLPWCCLPLTVLSCIDLFSLFLPTCTSLLFVRGNSRLQPSACNSPLISSPT